MEAFIQKEDYWAEWDLEQKLENLEKYIERNPLPINETIFAPTVRRQGVKIVPI